MRVAKHKLKSNNTRYLQHKTVHIDLSHHRIMEQFRNNPKRTRSHSLSSLHSDETVEVRLKNGPYVHRTNSDSSVDFCLHLDCDERQDSGICDRMFEGDMLVVLEQKIDRLSDMFLEQCRLLTTMKEEIRSSKTMMEKTELVHNQLLVDMLKNTIAKRVKSIDMVEASDGTSETVNSRAKSLLDAIESKKEVSIDFEVRASLINFLQSEELKEEMVRATSESVRGLIRRSFSRDMSTLYLPVLERSHRRLIGHIHRIIEQAFIELEDKSSSLFNSVYKTSGALRRALERHQCLLEATAVPDKTLITTLQDTVEELLQKELKEWRQNFAEMFSTQFHSDELSKESLASPMEYTPVLSPQPASSEVSIIDQMMQKALVKKKIEDGDVNGAFEFALSAADLSLVMTACLAVNPAEVFAAPCSLKQPVLLSLVQQLATDMLHETQIKCILMEQAILNLDGRNPDTQAHLPLVVGEVRKHLSKFLASYPNHVAGKRITLIVMAANKLLL